jgi:hypothetical protein
MDLRGSKFLTGGIPEIEDALPGAVIVLWVIVDHLFEKVQSYFVGDVIVVKRPVVQQEFFLHVVLYFSGRLEIDEGPEEIEVEEVLQAFYLEPHRTLTGDAGIFKKEMAGRVLRHVEQRFVDDEQGVFDGGIMGGEEAELFRYAIEGFAGCVEVVTFRAVFPDIALPGADVIEHRSGVAEDIGIVVKAIVVVEPVFGRDIIFIERDIIGLAGFVKRVVMSYDLEGIQVEIETDEKQKGYGKQ